MASTYTQNTGIEQPGSGEQGGTWGATINDDFAIIDRAISGVVTIDLSSAGSTLTLTSSDGALSDGQHRVLQFTSATTGVTVTIDPANSQKFYLVYNNSGYTLTFTQGSGGNVNVVDGDFSIIFADGAGAGAKVTLMTWNTAQLASDAIDATLIADNSITNAKMADDAIDTAEILDDAVTEPKIADDAVTADKILDGSITASKLATGAAFVSGMIMPYGGTSAPSGWQFTYGQAISRTTYADLFTAIGTTYGSGDGATTFNLPDIRGRVVAGQDDMGGSSANRLTGQSGGVNGDNLGAAGGNETHTLTIAQMPAHSHAVETHGASTGSTQIGSAGNDFKNTESTNSTGGGDAHNNVQPTIILNYIIKE